MGMPAQRAGRLPAVAASHAVPLADYVKRAEAAGLKWPLPEDQSDNQLYELLFPKTQQPTPKATIPARLGEIASGTAQKRGHAAVVVGGISGKISPRVRIQPILPAVPGLGREDQTHHAAGP